jgi:hypothetical protein
MPIAALRCALNRTEYSALASRLMDDCSRALIAERDTGDDLGFAHDLRNGFEK